MKYTKRSTNQFSLPSFSTLSPPLIFPSHHITTTHRAEHCTQNRCLCTCRTSCRRPDRMSPAVEAPPPPLPRDWRCKEAEAEEEAVEKNEARGDGRRLARTVPTPGSSRARKACPSCGMMGARRSDRELRGAAGRSGAGESRESEREARTLLTNSDPITRKLGRTRPD